MNVISGQDVDIGKCDQHVADVQTPESNCSDYIQVIYIDRLFLSSCRHVKIGNHSEMQINRV